MLKKIVVVLTTIICVWLIGSYYLFLQSSGLVFNPKNSQIQQPNSGYNLSFVKNKAGQNVSMWYFENITTDQVIIYLHGNAGRLVNFFPELTKKANVLSPAYPGFSESEGDPSVENTYEASELAYKSLTDKGVPENKITILGHSLGGSVATYLASKHPNAKKLVLVNTFSSIQSMCYKQYSIFCVFAGGIFNSAENAKKVTIPVREFAFRYDKTVPFDEGKKLYEYFTATSDKKFIEQDKQTHSFPDWDKVLSEL